MATLGIMLEAVNRDEYKLQSKVARRAGFQKVILFTPDDVMEGKKRIKGWVYHNRKWLYESRARYPKLIYDRGIYGRLIQVRKAMRVKMYSGVPFVGDWLGNNKWTIHKHMGKNLKLKSHLIPSKPLNHLSAVYAMLKKYKKIIIKPVGSHAGVGIIIAFTQNGQYFIKENKKPIKLLTKKEFSTKLIKLKSKRRHLIQKWMQFDDNRNRVYDIRVLMQKNKMGRWYLTGMGVRYAKKGSITSNLATGGEAVEVKPFLLKLFGAKRAKVLLKQMQRLSYELSKHLEHSFHKRLVELGLDFGIDRKAHIWIIEANTKPGKQLLFQLGKSRAYKQSLQLPIDFAGYLLKRMTTRKNNTQRK